MNKDLIDDNTDLSQEIMKLCTTSDTLRQNYSMVNILFGILLTNFAELYNLDPEIFSFDSYKWYNYNVDIEYIKVKFKALFHQMNIIYTDTGKLDLEDIEWIKESAKDITYILEGFILKDVGH